MTCGACGASGTIENDECTACGANQRRYRMPVKREQAQPPALWQQAAPVVMRGAALVAAGFIGEWLFRSAAKKAVQAPFNRSKKKTAVVKKEEPRETIAISETVVMRRVIVRR